MPAKHNESSTRSPSGLVPALLGPGIRALRIYWKIFLGIELAALCFVILYYNNAAVRETCSVIADFRTTGGLSATIFFSVLSGGIIPETLKWKLRPATLKPPTVGEILHRFGLFAVLGVLVDMFYRFQGMLFGTGTDPLTLAIKIVVDQLVFAPLVPLPLVVWWFLWREHHYNPVAAFRAFGWTEYRDRGLPIWSMGLTYWPIVLIFIYAMPSDLQFPLWVLINAAWSLIMIFIATGRHREPITHGRP